MNVRERPTVLEKTLTEEDRQLVAGLLANPDYVSGLVLRFGDKLRALSDIEELIDPIVLTLANQWRSEHRIDADLWALFRSVVERASMLATTISEKPTAQISPDRLQVLAKKKRSHEGLLRIMDTAAPDEDRAWIIAGLVANPELVKHL